MSVGFSSVKIKGDRDKLLGKDLGRALYNERTHELRDSGFKFDNANLPELAGTLVSLYYIRSLQPLPPGVIRIKDGRYFLE
jgi:hypothetical protein